MVCSAVMGSSIMPSLKSRSISSTCGAQRRRLRYTELATAGHSASRLAGSLRASVTPRGCIFQSAQASLHALILRARSVCQSFQRCREWQGVLSKQDETCA